MNWIFILWLIAAVLFIAYCIILQAVNNAG